MPEEEKGSDVLPIVSLAVIMQLYQLTWRFIGSNLLKVASYFYFNQRQEMSPCKIA